MKTMMVLAAIASVAIAASPASSGASLEVTRDLTLGADVAYDSVSVAANATLNLNGHTLRTGGLTGGGAVASFREMPLPRGYELLSHVTTPSNNLNGVKGSIDIEYRPNATDRIETKFRPGYVKSKSANIQWIFSARAGSALNSFDCYLNPAKLVFPYNTTGSLEYENAAVSGGGYEVVMDGGRRTLAVTHGDKTTSYDLPSNDFTPGYNLKLFCTAENVKERNAQGLTMYYFRVFNAAGGLEVNMLPALDPSGVAGFYDTVRRKFYKLSSGALTPGVVISYDALSYVKTPANNTGTFVDTGYKPSPSDRVETRVMFGDMSANQGIFSSRYNYNENTFNCMLRGNSKVSFEHVKSGKYEAYHTTDGDQTVYSSGKIYDLAMDGYTCDIEVNGVVSGTRMGSSLDATSTNFVLFACADVKSSSTSGFAKDLKMYSFRVTDTNGCERLNLVPARTRNGGVVGFYDTVRNRFLRTTIAATAESVSAATDLTTADATCWASLPGDGSTVANLFNDNFSYNNDSTHRFYIGESYILPVAIDYDFGEGNAKAVNMLRIYGGYSGRSPAIWAFYGSNDDAAFSAADESAWTLLDFKIDERAWTTGGKREMAFANDTPYRYYRLKAFAGIGEYFDLTQLEFLRVSIAATACPLEAGPAFADLTMPGGTCTARTADGSAFYSYTTAANLFNDNYIYQTDETHRLSVNNNARFPIAIDYDFGEGNAKAVNAYKVYGSMSKRCPTAWTVYGSDTAYGSADETGWTKLDSRTGVGNWTYVTSGNPADCKTFTFKNNTPYRYYRFLWQAGEATGNGERYNDMTQLEYFHIDSAETPGVLRVNVADGAAATNETVAVGGSLKVVKEGAGAFAACAANAFYTGGTVVKEGSFTVGAPLSTAMTLADGATLGFLLSQGVQSPLLALDAASSFPAEFAIEVGRSDSFKIPQSGFTLTDGFSFAGKTVDFANPSDFARKVKIDASGRLVVMGPCGFMIIIE